MCQVSFLGFLSQAANVVPTAAEASGGSGLLHGLGMVRAGEQAPQLLWVKHRKRSIAYRNMESLCVKPRF